MNIATKKIELLDWLLHINDENKLKQVIALKTSMDAEVVAYDVKGYAVTKEQYIHRVQEADERISSGKFTTTEDLENEIENW